MGGGGGGMDVREGKPGIFDVPPPPPPLSGISGLSLDSPFLSPLLFFCLVLLLSPSCHFSAHGPFLSENSQIVFVDGQAFLYGSC